MFIRRRINRMRFTWAVSTVGLGLIALHIYYIYPAPPPFWLVPFASLSFVFAVGFPFWAFLDWLLLTGED